MPGQVRGEMDTLDYAIPFHSAGPTVLTLTALPAALGFGIPARTILKYDLTRARQARIAAYLATVAGFAGSKLIAKYITAYSTNAASWLDLGTSEINLSLTQTINTPYVSAWTDIAPGANGDVFLALLTSGGNGVISPVLGNVVLQIR